MKHDLCHCSSLAPQTTWIHLWSTKNWLQIWSRPNPKPLQIKLNEERVTSKQTCLALHAFIFSCIYFCSLFAKRCAKNKPFKQKSSLSNEKIGAFAAAQQNRRLFAVICSIWFSVVHIHMPIVHIKLGDYHRKLGKLVLVLPPRALPPATPLPPPLMKFSSSAHAPSIPLSQTVTHL